MQLAPETAQARAESDAYYEQLFLHDPVWSKPSPNEDEQARWLKIRRFLAHAKAMAFAAGVRDLRILDVGCGRGWLTQLASEYGGAQGLEPVAAVVGQARRFFPHLHFTAGTVPALLGAGDFKPYDVLLCSEVIEHVPRDQQEDFSRRLGNLLRPGGVVILTTPRREALEQWTRLAGNPSQPVEDWLAEPEVRELFARQGFKLLGQDRVWFDPQRRAFVPQTGCEGTAGLLAVYQVWAFEAGAGPAGAGVEGLRDLASTPGAWPPESGFSFCIITNGKRPGKLRREIASIRALAIPQCEILVGGEPPPGLDEDILVVPAVDAARNGRLGEMRNRLVEHARYDTVIVADDDLVFHDDFYTGLRRFGDTFDVLCVRLLNPDGSRYWDWATHGGPRGHVLLDYDETDPHFYVTGGLCVLKSRVAGRVNWDEGRGFYAGEDLDFSARLRHAGLTPRFNPHSTVTHDDARYVQSGKGVVLQQAPDLTPVKAGVRLPIRWLGPIFNPSGYASEALNFLLPLAGRLDLGIYHHNNLYSEKFVNGLSLADRETLFGLRDRFAALKGGIAVSHNPANGFLSPPDADYVVGRTMFETDRLPRGWATACNRMDEVWVPSQFNVETFAASGVERDKLIVMPGAVDAREFDPARHTPLPLPNRAAYNFLAIFEWSSRKAWDILLAAYLREFSAEDDVCLHLRAYQFSRPDGDPGEALWRHIREHAAKLDLGPKPWPRIELLTEQVPGADLPRLYKAADCLVGISRGEGWGRPLHEAMMMGLPVIATNWSANTEFMTPDAAYLLDYELVEARGLEPELWHYRGHRWANPSERQLREVMRRLQQHPEEGRAVGQRARQHVAGHFSREAVAEKVVARLAEVERKLTTPALPAVAARSETEHTCDGEPAAVVHSLPIAWQGSFLDYGSLSHVNRSLTAALARQNGIQLTRVGKNALPASAAQQAVLREVAGQLRSVAPPATRVTIRHAWPPDWTPPASGLWVQIQPWEFGLLPAEWVEKSRRASEIWAYSEYVRRVYVDSGVEPAKVQVVPLGIDPELFRPDAPAAPLPTKKAFKFLFVGGTIRRKGADVLLEAWLKAFRASDDVCLVIKDFGCQGVYAGQTFGEKIREAQARPGAPEIVYLNEELPPRALPGLYRACDCLVHPYRGEGFGLPVLEAMACGLPVIITGGGAADDFATDEFAWRIPAVRKRLGQEVGGLKLAGNGWLLEPCATSLTAAVQWAAAHPEEARAKGRAASEHVRKHWTWQRAAQVAAQRLRHLVARKDAETAAIKTRRQRQPASQVMPSVAHVGGLEAARRLLGEGRLVDAWQATLEAMLMRPFHPEGWLCLAEIAHQAADLPTARQCAQESQRLAPKWKAARAFLKSLGNGVPVSGPACTAGPRQWPAIPAALTSAAAPRLSVCLIARNEERFLDQCLRSVRGIADQVVVLDTGSADRTIEIARAQGAEVRHFRWSDDFSAARNAALEHARGDWVLFIDADEELLPGSGETLLREIRQPEVMAYRLPILNAGREDAGPNYVPRLFRNAPGLFCAGRVHEHVFGSVEPRRQAWGLENRLGAATLRHHGYTDALVKDRNKLARNLRLLDQAVEECPNDPNLLMNLGLELARAGQMEAALEHYAEAFAVFAALPAAQQVPELREALLTQFATYLLGTQQFENVVKVLTASVAKSAGLTASQHFLLGLAQQQLGRLVEATAQMRECLATRNRPALTPVNAHVRKGGPHHCLAQCLAAQQQIEAADQAYRAALAEDATSRPLRRDYARFLAQQARSVQALELLYQLVSEDGDDLDTWRLGGRISLDRAELIEFARDWTEEACRHLPGQAALSSQRAEALLLSGDTAAALPLWQQADPAVPSHQAARILCALRENEPISPALECDERAVSQAFVKWYRSLLAWNAPQVALVLNERLDRLQGVLPTAAALLKQACHLASAAEPGVQT